MRTVPAVLAAPLLAAALLAGLPGAAPAQVSRPGAAVVPSPPPTEEAGRLAGQFLDRIGTDEMVLQLLSGTRAMVVTLFTRQGKTEREAGEIFDSFLLPAFKQRAPELRRRFVDILVADFTVPELRAIVNDEQNEARRSAAAKAGQLRGQFGKAGQEWGEQVGHDVYEENKATLQKLGLDAPGGSAK